MLVLLGFAAADFLITMTLSAADASAHVLENPFAPSWLEGHAVAITLVLLTAENHSWLSVAVVALLVFPKLALGLSGFETEGNPALNFLRFLVFGVGEVAPVAREVLREAEKDPRRRPRVHVS